MIYETASEKMSEIQNCKEIKDVKKYKLDQKGKDRKTGNPKLMEEYGKNIEIQ